MTYFLKGQEDNKKKEVERDMTDFQKERAEEPRRKNKGSHLVTNAICLKLLSHTKPRYIAT
jgi:hypothetical protein